MKSSEKRMIAILLAITVVAIIIVVIMNTNKTKEEKIKAEVDQTNTNVSMSDDGTTINNSDKLHETKKFEGMEINQIQLTEKEGEAQLIATVTNTSNIEQGDYPVMIKMVDKEGKEVATMDTYIGKLKPEKSMKLSAEATLNTANVYDFTIVKK